MANIQICIKYKDIAAEEEIPISNEIEETLRRVRMKRGADIAGEVTFQLTNEVCLNMTKEHTVKKLLHVIIRQLNGNKMGREI